MGIIDKILEEAENELFPKVANDQNGAPTEASQQQGGGDVFAAAQAYLFCRLLRGSRERPESLCLFFLRAAFLFFRRSVFRRFRQDEIDPELPAGSLFDA